ncbi:hypothetical protein BOSEA31B_20378 [Hyphomicrobiales bacterium]|nr:hypothetical protein BOSEA31B_20378 [Hyphomicrobiales bacterium]CAH1702246.1 hypothetical protein BOSEA1005_30118 [Hyphomicrobiales bacterium]CAI0346449.1 hypothetical protein BO1005MUT1_510090 [Hyphomicrobiales bacterium]
MTPAPPNHALEAGELRTKWLFLRRILTAFAVCRNGLQTGQNALRAGPRLGWRTFSGWTTGARHSLR